MDYASAMKIFILLSVMVLVPAFSSASEFTPSRATYYGRPNTYGTTSGACGFGEFGRGLNDGRVSAVSRLYRNGFGCGACYQVRCTNPKLCNKKGVNIVVTDYGEGDRTDFILSGRAYSKMALGGAEKNLFASGVVDVGYKRVPCQYFGQNIMYKVHENSRYPDYLALIFLYVGGENDIISVELWQDKVRKWVPMRRAYGAVWDMANPPRSGPIPLRFQVKDSAGKTKWVRTGYDIPKDWKVGAAYDSQVKLT